MNIQIIGTKKCRDTQKAERFFRERKINYHFRDLTVKGISKGELNNITRKIELKFLIDTEGKQYVKRNLAYMNFNIEEELLEDSLLLKTPIVRNGSEVTVGYMPDIWSLWIENNKPNEG